jgi:hypothetical protein
LTEQLVKYNDNELPANFVALAVSISNGEAGHSGLLIRYKGVDHLCHFPGNNLPEIVSVPNTDIYVYRVWDLVSTDDIDEGGAFLSHCKHVCDNSNIIYGYVHDGSSYDYRGTYQNRTDLPEIGTCVGFCLNILNHQVLLHGEEDKYFHIDDWNDEDEWFKYDEYAQRAIAALFPDVDMELYNSFKKRITPLQYLCSAYLYDYSIRRTAVDEIGREVEGYLRAL